MNHSKKLVAAVALSASCGSPAPILPPPPLPAASQPAPTERPLAEEAPPLLHLPADITPLSEAVELHIDPHSDRYSGHVDIEVRLTVPRRVIWLHGKSLTFSNATITPEGARPISAIWKERDGSGVASLSAASAVPVGVSHIALDFEAPFSKGGKGLYKTSEGTDSYVFTQFEAIAARSAFPCFDEPRYKIPFAVSLIVPKGMPAITNAHELSRVTSGNEDRVTFAKTEKLPSYLIAAAVGPLDIVAAPDVPANAVRNHPLPMRAVTAKGRGAEATYALAHAGEILQKLEGYTHVAYPFDKLDIIAVPGKGGAMENAGAVTFGEYLLLFDPKTAAIRQRRAYAQVTAHEFAHMWTGDLVTMDWWDDIWLNEAFATWLGNKAADDWDPTTRSLLSLLQGSQGAMGTDGLVSARAIRQPILSNDDIENGFDGITYQKGAGVLSMFERWVGPEKWQSGFTAYLEKHRNGNATADDFLDAENAASQKDVKAAFHTFLDQVGVPFVGASLTCANPSSGPATVHLTQARYLPLGSKGNADQTWKVPVCIRYGNAKSAKGEACTLVDKPQVDFVLPTDASCPAWVFPNADAAGYYRFSLAAPDLKALRQKGLPALSIREKNAYANSVRAGYGRGSTTFGDAIDALAPLSSESDPNVAAEPMSLIGQAHDWLFKDPLRAHADAYGRKLYGGVARKLGWSPRKGEGDDTAVLRNSVLGFLVDVVDDPAARKEAKLRGLQYLGIGKDSKLHPEAVSTDLAGLALGVVGEEATSAIWDAIYAFFTGSIEEAQRSRFLYALSAVRDPALVAKARELVLSPALRENEVLVPLRVQLNRIETRDEAWAWEKSHYDEIVARLPKNHGGVALIATSSVFCDEAHAAEVEAFFKPKVADLEGAPRALASAVETVRLCAARQKNQEPNVRAYFKK